MNIRAPVRPSVHDEIQDIRMTLARIEKALARIVPDPEPPQEALEQTRLYRIAKPVGEAYGLSVADLRSKERRNYISHPRQEAMLAMRGAGIALPVIARFFRRDNSTVIYGVAAAERRAKG